MVSQKQKYLILDFETRSKLDLKKVGAYEYAIDPSTEILSIAWKLGTRGSLLKAKTHEWCGRAKVGNLDRLLDLLHDDSIKIVAHNAGFEQLIVAHQLLGLYIPIERWVCTAAMAATHALPRKLEDVCEVLELSAKKDPEGGKLITKYCKPRKPTKNNPTIWNNDVEGLKRLTLYCARDVDATAELFLSLPLLSPMERKVWELNQDINQRGIYADRRLVKSALRLIDQETKRLTKKCLKLTGGIAPTQREKLRTFLNSLGCNFENMRRKTLEDFLKESKNQKARAIVEVRLASSKTSTAKYVAFDLRSKSDSRVRDLQLYHGASTGREAGTGVQPHNFPRGTLKDPDTAIDAILEEDIDWIRALAGEPMEAMSSCLRGVIQATPGFELYCGDFKQIEVRVLFWLADHVKGLNMFINDEDLYVDQAAPIYDVDLDSVITEQRDVGKRAVLGCGFEMGAPKFADTCEQFGQPISPELARRAVSAYREKHKPVTKLWRNLERAVVQAVRNPGKSFSINKTKWFKEGKYLYCELPSGRRLAYFKPRVKMKETPWGEPKASLSYWGTDPKTKKWVEIHTYGGHLTENVVQATARDFMVTSQLRTADAGYIPLISVHDECLAERLKGRGSLKEFEKLMSKTPKWAKGFPLAVEGWKGDRYRK